MNVSGREFRIKRKSRSSFGDSKMESFKAFNILFVLVGIVTPVFGQGNRYIERQLFCALDKAPCDAFGQQIKAALPEIIGNGCQNCDRTQINNVKRIARFVQTRYPLIWTALVEKYATRDE